MYAIRSYYVCDRAYIGSTIKMGKVIDRHRITSYNVCYTKLLRVTITYTNKDTFMFKALAAYLKDDTYIAKDGEKYLVYTNRYQMSELSKRLDSDDETMALCKKFDVITSYSIHYTKLYEN